MSREISSYLQDEIKLWGDPKDWDSAVTRIINACSKLGHDRHLTYGPGNINKFGHYGLIVRIWDKMERIYNIIFNDAKNDNESLEDSFGDLANYGVYGVMVSRGWWDLPVIKTENDV